MAARPHPPPSSSTPNATPFSRLSRIGFGFPFTRSAGPSSPVYDPANPQDDDWYIPYNGPYEEPKERIQNTNSQTTQRDSWGDLLNGWLSDNGSEGVRFSETCRVDGGDGIERSRSISSRLRAVSNASHYTTSSGVVDPPRKSSTSSHPPAVPRPGGSTRMPVPSFVNSDQAGGIGEAPMPRERAPHTNDGRSIGEGDRRSFATSILSFGKKHHHHHHSQADPQEFTSRGGDSGGVVIRSASTRQQILKARQRAISAVEPGMEGDRGEYNHYSSLLVHQSTADHRLPPDPQNQTTSHPHPYQQHPLQQEQNQQPFPVTSESPTDLSLRSHPYAVAFPTANTSQPQPATTITANKPRTRFQLLLPTSNSNIPDYLKPSPRNSILKTSISTPNLKGKQRWLSAESWCDALILPRPRFALRLVDQGAPLLEEKEKSSGRIVSPPGSPILESEANLVERSQIQQQSQSQSNSGGSGYGYGYGTGSIRKSESANAVLGGPSVGIVRKVTSIANILSSTVPNGNGRSGNERAGGSRSEARNEEVRDDVERKREKTLRPKSFAYDDLALLSPVPSLMKVLEDGKKLDADRAAWQKAVSSSAFQTSQVKRSRSLSKARARSKSLNASRSPVTAPTKEELSSAFDKILLGGQIRPPTIHVHGPKPSLSSSTRSRSRSATVTDSSGVNPLRSFSLSGHGQGSTKTRSRSGHGHSNSLGNSTALSHSTESGVSGGRHTRSQSMSKNALKLVRNTAAFCGLTSNSPEQPGSLAQAEKDGLEGALRSNGTKFIKLGDNREEWRFTDGTHGGPESVVMISPPMPANAARAMLHPASRVGASPTPSNLTGSAEGIGLAISSPLGSSLDHSEREAINLSGHPYAQGVTYHSQPKPTLNIHMASNTSHDGHGNVSPTDSPNKHRQPVVHPYAQPGHPYANLTAGPSIPRHIEVPSPSTRLYAELTPGHIRAFSAEDIQYSPYSGTPTEAVSPSDQALATTVDPSTFPDPSPSVVHPYASNQNRYSEVGFADALTRTLRGRPSMDSGLGTSETGLDEQAIRDTLDFGAPINVLSQSRVLVSSPDDYSPSDGRPHMIHGQTSSSSQVLPASELGHLPINRSAPLLVRPTPKRETSSATNLSAQYGNSSGSSPGMISQSSSPPLSPRPLNLNTSDDLERFKDLFYKPPERTSTTSSSSPLAELAGAVGRVKKRPSLAGLISRQNSDGTGAGIPLDISSQSSRSVSGLTNLARQLSEDLEDLREEQRELERLSGSNHDGHRSGDFDEEDVDEEDDEEDMPMWGRRYGGLRGNRPEEDINDPNVVLAQASQISDDSDSPQGGAKLPLRLPTRNDPPFGNPSTNFPEDIGPEEVESSRASSILEGSEIHEELAQYVRVGEVEAVSTPPVVKSPQRFSTALSINYEGIRNQLRPRSDERALSFSQHSSSLMTPVSPNAARSSYMTTNTDGSRMSGLSDFPVPPQAVNLSHFSANPTLLGALALSQPLSQTVNQVQSQDDSDLTLQIPEHPPLLREPSHDTFGTRSADSGDYIVGEAI
ncbi:hypothetical protein C8Q75DRAFT_812074 [Abortiporus biennis]|nr:hypothetical protein C8Q75DRAFT_812074 [Abortiporus biennis]